MAKRKVNVTPGKGGIGHNVRRVMKSKTQNKPNKSVKVLCKENKSNIVKYLSNDKKGKVLGEIKVDQNINVASPINMDDMCEYEKIRLKNIQEREALFAQLGINAAKEGATPVQKQKLTVIKKEKGALKENLEPERKSKRLAGGKVPEIKRFSYSEFGEELDGELVSKPRRTLLDYDDPELISRSRRSLPRSDYLEATKTFSGANEKPESLEAVPEDRFKILQVPKKCTIKQFVLSNNLEFKCGRGFYEFTKPEIISHRKEVVLVEKSSGRMFTGRDACRMIGAGSGIRIPPTAFKTWRVFVQSTSYGRCLVANTGFLYEV